LNTKYSNSYVRDRRSIRLKGYDYRLPGAYFITIVGWQRECSFGEIVDGRIQLNSIGKIIQKEWQQLVRHFPQIRLDAFVVMPNHIHGIIVIETAEADDPSLVRANRHSAEESRDTNDIPVDQMKGNFDGSLQIGRATRPSTEKIRATNDIPVDQMKGNFDGSLQIGRATRPTTEKIRATNDIPVDQMKGNFDGSPQQIVQTRRPNGPQTNSLGAMIGQFKSLATKRIWALADINRHPIWQRNYYEHIIRDDLEYQRIVQYIENNPLQWHEDQLRLSVR
jgi:putative transposase